MGPCCSSRPQVPETLQAQLEAALDKLQAPKNLPDQIPVVLGALGALYNFWCTAPRLNMDRAKVLKAIPHVTALLGPEWPVAVQKEAAGTLAKLAEQISQGELNLVMSDINGAVTPLVQLLHSQHEEIRNHAVRALLALLNIGASMQPVVIAIPPLVQMLVAAGPPQEVGPAGSAAGILKLLAVNEAGAVAISQEPAAITNLVSMLPGVPMEGHSLVAATEAASALANLASHDAIRAEVYACRAIPPLLQMLGNSRTPFAAYFDAGATVHVSYTQKAAASALTALSRHPPAKAELKVTMWHGRRMMDAVEKIMREPVR